VTRISLGFAPIANSQTSVPSEASSFEIVFAAPALVAYRFLPSFEIQTAWVRAPGMRLAGRSEERRVGKECRSRWSPYH